MKSLNYGIEHEILVIERESEILIVTKDGEEIASLVAETMEMDVEVDGKRTMKPTQNYWVCFKPKHCTVDKEFADVNLGTPVPLDIKKIN